MSPGRTAEVRRRRAELVERVKQLDDTADLFAEASRRLQRLVPHDAAGWSPTDPGTGLPVSPSRIENVPELTPDQCRDFWHRELLQDDVNRFSELAGSDVPAAALRQAIGDPSSSARYRDFLRPQQIEDELRIVLRAGNEPWGFVSLWRRDRSRPFSEQETRIAGSLSEPLGEVLRKQARRSGDTATGPRPERPGVMLFGADGVLKSINDAARMWLDELPDDMGLPSELDVEVPFWMLATVFRARALADEGSTMSARARVRTRRDTWLVCHGSCLLDSSGAGLDTAVVLEPAKGADVAPIVVQAYDLSRREQEITRLVARGAATNEIANELFLSHHTVRDHIKAIFSKVGVSSRGELVATLFADHYWPEHDQEVIRIYDA